MTQILAALTQEYVLVASDRQLTFVSGPHQGKVADDDTCKLVLLCGVWGIAYTGLSRLDGAPTHEWIAVRLAKENCCSPYVAAQVFANEGARALKGSRFQLELTFLIAGWVRLEGGALQPHFQGGGNMILAMEPNLSSTSFCYFDPVYSELRQYRPTWVCGDSAVTDVETENDPSRAFQSSLVVA
jgi:hypothetical protein